jgi:hypothetical protein
LAGYSLKIAGEALVMAKGGAEVKNCACQPGRGDPGSSVRRNSGIVVRIERASNEQTGGMYIP